MLALVSQDTKKLAEEQSEDITFLCLSPLAWILVVQSVQYTRGLCMLVEVCMYMLAMNTFAKFGCIQYVEVSY